jgi:hypothetical protein
MPTFWVPNVILSSDYLITVAPLKTYNGTGSFSIKNLLTLLPSSKYQGDTAGGWESLYNLGIDKVLATCISRCLSTWASSRPGRSSP